MSKNILEKLESLIAEEKAQKEQSIDYSKLAVLIADQISKKQEGGKQEEKEEPEPEEEKAEVVDDKDLKILSMTLSSSLKDKGFDKDNIKNVMSYLNYDMLLDEDGAINDEEVESLVDSLSSLALREPPKQNKKKKASDGSFAQYLD